MFMKRLLLFRIISVVLMCLMINPMFVTPAFAYDNSAIIESMDKGSEWIPGELLASLPVEEAFRWPAYKFIDDGVVSRC